VHGSAAHTFHTQRVAVERHVFINPAGGVGIANKRPTQRSICGSAAA